MKRQRGIQQSIYIYPEHIETLRRLSPNTSDAVRTATECIAYIYDKYPELMRDALISTGNANEETEECQSDTTTTLPSPTLTTVG